LLTTFDTTRTVIVKKRPSRTRRGRARDVQAPVRRTVVTRLQALAAEHHMVPFRG
jgi:hypothetical protein